GPGNYGLPAYTRLNWQVHVQSSGRRQAGEGVGGSGEQLTSTNEAVARRIGDYTRDATGQRCSSARNTGAKETGLDPRVEVRCVDRSRGDELFGLNVEPVDEIQAWEQVDAERELRNVLVGRSHKPEAPGKVEQSRCIHR